MGTAALVLWHVRDGADAVGNVRGLCQRAERMVVDHTELRHGQWSHPRGARLGLEPGPRLRQLVALKRSDKEQAVRHPVQTRVQLGLLVVSQALPCRELTGRFFTFTHLSTTATTRARCPLQ